MDAFTVADRDVVEMCKSHLVPLSVSTQMSVSNSEAATPSTLLRCRAGKKALLVCLAVQGGKA
ncbi:MAG: hypothetical protein E7046_01265 [Lentisphaerae bacterium]|nr:hypothetical protein [Lentisphaerota bacterium]